MIITMASLMVAVVTVIATAKWQNLSFPCTAGLFSDEADMYNTGGGKNEKTVLLCLTLCLVMSLPLFAEDVAYDAQALDFIEENIEKAFITGKTSYLIEGRMVSEPTDVYNHLELVSYHVEPDGESVILTRHRRGGNGLLQYPKSLKLILGRMVALSLLMILKIILERRLLLRQKARRGRISHSEFHPIL